MGGRAALWLPLLRALTDQTPAWAIWKNAESALDGTGDVDSVAPRRAWPLVDGVFQQWAAEQRLAATILCRHIPRTLNLLALAPGSPDLLQLEVKAGATFRGSVQFHARDVLALSVLDERGFRRLRPGAEGLLKLLNNGLLRGGRPDWQGIRAKGVQELLRSDPDGVTAMADRLGPAGRPLLRGAAAVLSDHWDRRAMATVEAWALARAVTQPHVVAERIWFRAVRKPRCPVLQVVYRRDRRVPGDLAAWRREVERSHRVVAPA